VTETRISELPAATDITGAELAGIQGGTTKRFSVTLISESGTQTQTITLNATQLLALITSGAGLKAAIDENDSSKIKITLTDERFTSTLKNTYDGYGSLIQNEIDTRRSADTALNTAIDNEIAKRAADDSALATRIDDEVQLRNSVDDALATRIDKIGDVSRLPTEPLPKRLTLARLPPTIRLAITTSFFARKPTSLMNSAR